jgi:exonuclease VII small subunit
VDLSEALRKYQAAADYYGETQLQIAQASERFQLATANQQTAYSVLQTAQQELLKAARDVKLPERRPGPGPDEPTSPPQA